MMRLVFLDTDAIGEIPNKYLLDEFGHVSYYQTTKPEETQERVKDSDVIITNKVVLDRSTIEQSSKLKIWIRKYWKKV